MLVNFLGGVCVNTEGSYTCRCPSGLTQAVSQTGTTSCVDERVEPCYMEYRLGWWIFSFLKFCLVPPFILECLKISAVCLHFRFL